MENEECKKKVYLPFQVYERHIAGRSDCGEWLPYLDGTKAVAVISPSVAARVYSVLRETGDPDAAAAAARSEEQLNWHLTK